MPESPRLRPFPASVHRSWSPSLGNPGSPGPALGSQSLDPTTDGGVMPDRPATTIDQPFRSSFLSHLDAEDRRIIEAFGHLVESAVLDALPGRLSEPFSLTLSRAALEDLDALLLHTREGVGSWESRRDETSEELRAAMVETLATLERARAVLAPVVEAETRTHQEETHRGDADDDA